MYALVTCRLDTNNALLYGLLQHLLNDLQRCQNSGADSHQTKTGAPHHSCAHELALVTSEAPH